MLKPVSQLATASTACNNLQDSSYMFIYNSSVGMNKNDVSLSNLHYLLLLRINENTVIA